MFAPFGGQEALRQLLQRKGGLPSGVVVCFEAPTKQWIDSLTTPAVNFFLFDIQENKDRRETNLRKSGAATDRRMPPRRMDLSYFVTAFATSANDECELLWRVLETLMMYQELPSNIVSEFLQDLEFPLTARLGEKDESARIQELCTSFGIRPHPALCYVLTAPLDLNFVHRAPLVIASTTRVGLRAADETLAEDHDTFLDIGGTVRDRDGNPVAGVAVHPEGSARAPSVTNLRGEFRLDNVPAGPLRLVLQRRGTLGKSVHEFASSQVRHGEAVGHSNDVLLDDNT